MALFDETPLGRTVREQALGQPDPALRQYTPDLGQAALSRGAEQAVGLGADYLGSVAGANDQRQLADNLYQFADDRIRSAGRRVAGPQTTDDITGPGQLGDFIVNKAGESLPVSAAAIAGGLATRGRGLPTQLGASSLPIFPTLAGETSYAMRNDPESGATELERAVASTGAGAASAALEVLPEVGILNRVLGRSAVEPAKDMARAIVRGAGTTGSAIAGEAVTEAAQTAVSRTAQSLYNENIGVNPITDAEARKDYIEAAAAGAAGGTAFGVPAGVATTLQNLPTGPDVQLPQGEDIRQFIGDVLTPRSERIAPEDIPANMDDAVAQEMQRDQTLTERARAFRDRLMQRGDLTPEEAASIDQEVELDPDAQNAVFDLYEQKAVQDTIRNSIARMQNDEGRASRVVPNIPMEAVDSIIQEAGIDEASATPEVRQWLSVYQDQLSNGTVDQQTITDALNIFGERGYSVLRVLAGSNQNAQNTIDADQANNGQLDNFLFQALKPEYRDSILPGQLRQLGNMVRNATERGDGNLDEILGVAFQNPREVMAGLDTLQRNTSQGVAQQTTESEDGGEIGDTQSVQDVEQRYFGDTRGNRRISTGGLNIPYPMSRDEFGSIVDVARNVRGLAPESDIIEVPAVSTLRRLGVDPADVATEMGVSEQDLRNMVFLQGTSERPVDTAKGFIRTLRTNTLERLNNTPRDPSAGSYLGMKTGNNRKAALDARLMVNSRVFGNRNPAALLQAFADGVSLALSEGYKLDGPIPDNLVLARYGRGNDEVTVTLGEAKAAVGSRAPTSAEGNMPLDPQVYNTLQENGYDPKVDFDSGELFLPRSDVVEIIERYAAAVASRNAAARNTAIPAWTERLISRHGVDFPEAFGRLNQPGSLINQVAAWANSEGIDSRALTALTGRRTDPARAVEARREREATEQAGPATGIIESDSDTAQAQLVEVEAGIRSTRLVDDEGQGPVNAEGEFVEPREGAAARKPERPYAVRGRSDREDFFTMVRKAEKAHSQQFWATGELPTGIDLQGPYAVLGKLAARGEPLQVVVSKAQGQEITPDIQRLIEAYQRRGFNIRTENKVTAPIEDAPYSERVIARVLGVDGVSPAHVVMTIGDGPSARLARRIGIPIIDLTNPVQQKIAGDVLRSYDRGRRQDISRSNDAPEVKAMKRKGEERAGADRSRDILATDIERQLAANWNNPDAIQRLDRLFALMNRVDNDFFEAGLAGRSASELASPIRLQALETYERAYNKEQGKPSLSRPGRERTATEEQFDNARDYIAKVLPPDVRVLVKKMSNMSGQYLERQLQDGDIDKIIELSAYANDPMSTAHHESMHALIASMRGQKEQSAFIKALLKAADSPLVISQLRSLLRNEPAALEQMVNDPEERIAYMYEFWAAGKLNLAPSVENWFVKLVRTIRGVLGILDNNEKAGLYMAAFRDGAMREPSAVNNVVMESLSGPERALRAVPVAQASERIVRKVIETAHGRLKSYGNPALSRIADAFYSDSTTGGQRSGYLQTTRDVVNMYGSQFNEIMRGSTADSVNELATALHTNTRPAGPEQAARYDQVKALLRRLYNYMRDSGVELGKVNDYYPQSWDKAAIEDDRAGFEAMLVRSAQYRDEEGRLLPFTPSSAAITADTLLGNNGRLELQEDLAGFSPFMEAGMTREIVLTDRADAAEYLDPDMIKVVTRYITQAAKRGEYTRHFGEDGVKLKQWLEEAKGYGITELELQRDIAPAIQAMEGTLGHNINQVARDFMSGTITVLNLAVLPLAVFSSLIDPMGIAVRGGTVEQAWDAFKAGVRNIPGSLRANGKKLDIQEFAESVGTVESQFTVDMLGDMYGSAYMSDWARKANNLLFRYNLMEGWNTAMRSSATIAALDFIKRHAAGENKNSARYLDELGLSADTLVLDEAGNVLWRQADIAQRLLETGRDPEQAQAISRRTREGITRWVDGAVLRPHAAHRPAWASDPHYMLIWHLKQFTYSFHKTIIERVMHETKNGNYNPMLVLASYVPFMIAADYLRGLVQGGGEEPPWRKDMSFGETVWEGVQRAGLLGIRQFAVDGADNPAFALGPAANYAIDIGVKAADGQVTDALVKALPGNALWKGW